MKIEHYISQLLYRYQCVTVPGFGAFLTETQSAQVEQHSNSFYPPKKLLSFNGYLKNNDGLLANHIAQSEKMAYEVAVSIIENQVQNWKNRLQELGSISLHNIGEIELNSEKNVVFTPFEKTNYLTDSFGLTSYVSPAVKRELEEIASQVRNDNSEEVIELHPERKSSSFMKYAAIFVIGAGMLSTGGYFGNEYYQNKIAQETLLVETNVQKRVNQKIQEATFFISNPLTTETPEVVAVQTPYHIVAGVYNKAFFAEQYLEQLKTAGYDAKLLGENKYGLFTVLYGSYATNEEALSALQIIHREHNKQAWLLVQ